uniref:Uncharacterized protein n=1 Tax=Cacopsylla melanoneura TaxID=428564 RepID=A0A8D8ZUS8_9HEMI
MNIGVECRDRLNLTSDWSQRIERKESMNHYLDLWIRADNLDIWISLYIWTREWLLTTSPICGFEALDFGRAGNPARPSLHAATFVFAQVHLSCLMAKWIRRV